MCMQPVNIISAYYTSTQAFPSKSEIEHTEAGRAGQENNHTPEQVLDTQDANMKDAPSCEKCGQIFPWNQLQIRWKHKCTGSADTCENVAKVPTTVAKCRTLPQSSWYTGPSTTRGRAESDSQQAANDEDAPKCEKCGRIFPWNQPHLRWKHRCEPTEVDDQWQRSMSSTPRKLLPAANAEQLSDSCTVEPGVINEAGEAYVCRCGKTFADNELRKFMMHNLQCPKGTPVHPQGAQGATLRKL